MSVNNYRKCAKCEKTRAEDMTVTYHRFPMPGKTNITKARAWAKYCWPNQDWTSEESLLSLYNSNKVLCGRHFSSTQFYDEHRQKLSKYAVPDSRDVVTLLHEQENVFQENEDHLSNESQVSLFEKENMQVVEPPSTLTQQSSFRCPTCSQPVFNEQITAQEIPHSTATKAIHDKNDTHLMPATANKKHIGILRSLNISKMSVMTAREVKMYEICQKNLVELKRLREELKEAKNLIKKLSESK